MLTLSNGATVHAAYIVPEQPGMKPHGIVLASNDREWIVWNIYWDGVFSNPNIGDGSHEVWEAETGDYFYNLELGRHRAEHRFGERLARLISDHTYRGIGHGS